MNRLFPRAFGHANNVPDCVRVGFIDPVMNIERDPCCVGDDGALLLFLYPYPRGWRAPVPLWLAPFPGEPPLKNAVPTTTKKL